MDHRDNAEHLSIFPSLHSSPLSSPSSTYSSSSIDDIGISPSTSITIGPPRNDPEEIDDDTSSSINMKKITVHHLEKEPLYPSSSSSLSLSSQSSSSSSSNHPSHVPLTRIQLFLLCLPVVPSQLGWAVGEALLIPYLVALGVEETLANGIWLINPFVGFIVQPIIGGWSDRFVSRWGRRRPFLVLFQLGVIFGLFSIAFAEQLHTIMFTTPALIPHEGPTTSLLIIIFTGCVILELSNDCLTIPARALLNDSVDEHQLEQGNAYFATMNSLGAVIGLMMCFLPLHDIWPLSYFSTQLKATFVVCILIIFGTTIFTIYQRERSDDNTQNNNNNTSSISSGHHILHDDHSDHPLVEMSNLHSTHHERSTSITSTSSDHDDITTTSASASASASASSSLTNNNNNNNNNNDNNKPSSSLSSSHHHEEAEEVDPESIGCLQSLMAFRLLPRELVWLWITQFFWWLCVMQISFWWTTWQGIEIYHADAVTQAELFYEGVHFGIIGSLIQSVVCFFASQVLTPVNERFGVLRVYHISASLFAISCMILWWCRTKTSSVIFMIITGILYPVVNTNPFIIIERIPPQSSSSSSSNSHDHHLSSLDGHEHDDDHINILQNRGMKDRSNSEDVTLLLGNNDENVSPNSGNDHDNHHHLSSSSTHHNNTVSSSSSSSSSQQLSASEHRGVLTAIFNLSMGLSQIVSSTIMGLIINWYGDITIVFFLAGASSLICNVLVMTFQLSTFKNQPPPSSSSLQDHEHDHDHPSTSSSSSSTA